MGDHMVTILVLDTQAYYHCASILQGRGWKDVLYPQFPCDCQFFLSVQMGLSCPLASKAVNRVNRVKMLIISILLFLFYIFLLSFFFLLIM